jgi:acyl transferase domain-containing protein/acyl carrier protein/SAM-dependent methyltransferase
LSEVSVRTGIPPAEIDADERLSRYGLDSVKSTSLITDLGIYLGRRLSPTLFWQYPTIEALSGYLASGAAAGPAEDGARDPAPPEPIAIIGMACRLPGAPGVSAFWELLRDGKDAVRDVPPDRWNLDDYYSADPQAPGKIIARRAGFINDIDRFDALFYSISPREAAEVDPQQRLVLELCWEALEDAGVPPDSLRGSLTGVFMGAIWHDYADLHRRVAAAITAHTGLGQALDIIANRASYFLGLQGPSLAIDSACSSSLVAVHLACQSLRSGESTLALAGGVSLILSPETMVALSKFGGLSPDGRSMAFDARANGFARGEGAGVVVLKPLSAALTAGDPIYCVIRGSAVNNDGFSNGLSAPNPAAQESVLRQAYRRSGVSPSQVHYVEAHGTGTPLGDPIEAAALGAVLGAGRAPEQPLCIGSVKTNIGHLEGASGIAGLIKTALAIRHRTIPASLHFEQPNPYIPFEELHVRVQTATGPWPGTGPAIGGVSSFGWGGTNCHLVMEGIGGIAADAGSARQTGGRLVFVCSPYGSQWLGMGRELMATEPVFRAKLQECDRALRPLMGWSVLAELASFQAGAKWNDVSTVQPLLFAFQVALAAQWRAWGIVPDAIVGHSLGEIAAAHIAGALNLQDAALTIYHYSRLQAQQAGGGMAIIGLGAVEVETELAPFGGQVVVAAHNSPRTTVLSGRPDLLRNLMAELAPRGVYCSVININVAAHSPDIEGIMDELRARLVGIAPRRPSIPMISTLTGKPVAEDVLDGHYWARNLRSPVLLAEAIDWLLACDYGTFVELAPHAVMGHALEQCIAAAGRQAVVLPSCRRDEGERRTMLTSLSALAARKVPPGPERPVHVLALSAKTVEALREMAKRYADAVRDESLADFCYSANTGRAQFSQRVAAWASSAAQLRERLLGFAAGSRVEGVEAGDARRGSPAKIRFVASDAEPARAELWRSWGVEVEDSPKSDAVEVNLAAGWEEIAGTLCALWVRGVKVNWANFDRDYPRRRIAIPSYPFQRTRYWFSPGDSAGHALPSGSKPLAGRRVRSAVEPIQFESELSPRQPGYLGEHRVQGTALLPTAAYLEMVLDAAQEALGPEERHIEAMTLQEPLWFSADHARAVNLILEKQSDAHRFRVSSQGSSGPWVLHVDGKLRRRQLAPTFGWTLDGVRSRCRETVDVDALYDEFARVGLHYGPVFRLIRGLWRGHGEAVGEIVTPEGGATTPMLDAALQVLFAALPPLRDDLRVYLPISLETFSFTRPAGSRVWSHAAIREQGGSIGESFTVDIRICDESGRLIGEISGFHLRRTAADREAGTWKGWLYCVQWRPSELRRAAGMVVEVAARAMAEVPRIAAEGGLERYRKLAPRLGDLAAAYAVDMLRELGFDFRLGEVISQDGLCRNLGIASGHRRMLSTMLRMIAEDGYLQPDGDGWRVVGVPPPRNVRNLANAIRREFPDDSAELTLLERCGERLAGVLTGTCDALEVLFPNGSLTAAEAFYTDSTFSRASNRLLCGALKAAAAKSAGTILRVLEIGAGTGAATSAVLPLLDAERTEYTFTDVSPIFLQHAQQKFSAYPCLRYELLDIEREPAAATGFDIVIAANILHATADLCKSLRHIARRMKPDGMLVLLEVTRCDRWVDLVFGLTDGWWKFADHHLRPGHALLPAHRWVELLRAEGFTEPVAIPQDDTWGQALILARYPGRQARSVEAGTRPWWIFGDAGGLGHEVTRLLKARGERCVTMDTEAPGDVPAGGLEGVIHLRTLDCVGEISLAALEASEERSCRSLVEILQALVKSGQPNRRGIWIVTRGAQPVDRDEAQLSVAQSAVWGLGRVAANEHPEHWGGMIDLDPRESGGDAERIVAEVTAPRNEDQIAWRARQRNTVRLVRAAATPGHDGVRFRGDACYLITGGLGGLGMELLPWMTERGARHIALAGRSVPTPEARRALDALSSDVRVTVHQADVSREQDVAELLASVAKSHPPLAGVFHAAGVLRDAVLLQQDRNSFREVTKPKVLGAWNLHRLTADLPLEYFVLFSSQTSLLGSAGQANHAAANAFLDALAHYRRGLGLSAMSVNWGAWKGIGAAAQGSLATHFTAHGIRYIEPRQALSALEHLLQQAPAQRAVMHVDWPKFAQVTAAGRSPMFSELLAEFSRREGVASRAKEDRDIGDRLRVGSAVERRAVLLEHIRRQAELVLRLEDEQRLDPEQPFIELGMDSLMALELKNHVESQLGLVLPVVRILEGASARQLAEQLMEKLEVNSLIDSVHSEASSSPAVEWDLLKI